MGAEIFQLASLRNGRAGSGVIVLPTEVCADVRPSSCESKIRPSTSALFSANPASQHHHHHNTLPIKPPTGNNIGNIEIKSEWTVFFVHQLFYSFEENLKKLHFSAPSPGFLTFAIVHLEYSLLFLCDLKFFDGCRNQRGPHPAFRRR